MSSRVNPIEILDEPIIITGMHPRIKKLIGIAIILPYMALYIVAAVAIADFVPSHWATNLIYFSVAGTAWAFPLKRMMLWMNAPADTDNSS
ncbi:MAG: DUF2842 domain-containing protein [Pseudomonadota bacterium]